MNTQSSRVRFTDGFAVASDVIIVSSHLVEQIDANLSRIFTMKGSKWFFFDLEARISSLCLVERPIRGVYGLGLNGVLHVTRSGQTLTQTERVIPPGPERAKLGFVTKIREIAGTLYVCGMSGQIYQRGASTWVPIDDGVVDPRGAPKALDLYCIDGTSENDIYAVGQQGLVWHRTNKSWNRINVTDQNVNWVRCVSPDEVYLACTGGTFFRGHGDHWEDFSVPKMQQSFECVEAFKGRIYLATLSGLYSFDGKKVSPVDTGLNPVPDGNHLHAKDGVLWSFGPNHICFFDGKKWTYLKHPDNP